MPNKYRHEGVWFCMQSQTAAASFSFPSCWRLHDATASTHIELQIQKLQNIPFQSCYDEFRVCFCLCHHQQVPPSFSSSSSASTASSYLYQGDTRQAINSGVVNPLNTLLHTPNVLFGNNMVVKIAKMAVGSFFVNSEREAQLFLDCPNIHTHRPTQAHTHTHTQDPNSKKLLYYD